MGEELRIGEAGKSKNPVEVGVFGRPFSESGTSQAAIFSVPPSNRIVVGCFFFLGDAPRGAPAEPDDRWQRWPIHSQRKVGLSRWASGGLL